MSNNRPSTPTTTTTTAEESTEPTCIHYLSSDEDEDEEEYSDHEDLELQLQQWAPRRSGSVMLEGYIEAMDGSEDGSESLCGGSVARTMSLTDEDLEELKGCVDLGFGFSYEEIPDLCGTLPALELCYSMSMRFSDEQHKSFSGEPAVEIPGIANWKISSPGDDPEDVKARLKYWAQAVACTVKLCN